MAPRAAGGAKALGATLRRFADGGRPTERCELCGRQLGPGHDHLVEPPSRALLCACAACAILFSDHGATRYRRVPRRVRRLLDFHMTDGQWDSLLVPIGLAFFCRSSSLQHVVACYPSPAGPIESTLELEHWSDLERDNPVLKAMTPDVEALLVDRVGHARGETPAEYYLVPIDDCYRLVGLIRREWRGLSGGQQVWAGIATFFAELRDRSDVGDKDAPAAPGKTAEVSSA